MRFQLIKVQQKDRAELEEVDYPQTVEIKQCVMGLPFKIRFVNIKNISIYNASRLLDYDYNEKTKTFMFTTYKATYYLQRKRYVFPERRMGD